MFYIVLYFIFCLALVFIFLLIAIFLSYYVGFDREIGGRYECGFNPIYRAHLPYSVRFFKIAVVFLLFDIELVLLIPLVYYFKYIYFFRGVFVGIIFLFILILGLIYEWKQGLLEWVI